MTDQSTPAASAPPPGGLSAPRCASQACGGELAGRDGDRGPQVASGDSGWTRLEARAFNAVGSAVRDAGQWLPLSARRAVANAVLAVVQPELEQLAALRAVARGYCPHCGRGDAAPTVEDWERERDRADEAERRLLRIAEGSPRADAVQAEIGEMIAQTHELRAQLRSAEAAIARVHALAEEHLAGIDTALIHAALDEAAPGPAHRRR